MNCERVKEKKHTKQYNCTLKKIINNRIVV